MTQENDFHLHEFFHESILLVIVQAFCYICYKKISMKSSIILQWFWFFKVHYFQFPKLFVTIAIRKYSSLSWFFSWIYTTYLQLCKLSYTILTIRQSLAWYFLWTINDGGFEILVDKCNKKIVFHCMNYRVYQYEMLFFERL